MSGAAAAAKKVGGITAWANKCIANHQEEKVVFASLGMWASVIGGAVLLSKLGGGSKKDEKPAAQH
eukprot:EC783950.1.p4 GENE.EC783950.1~~EC783950.1.p4  ORF type:complete len:66 (+),score=29.47 EC783950.1:57-254(+)